MRNTFFVITFLLSGFTLFSQSDREMRVRCSTTEYMEMLASQDPDLLPFRERMERKLSSILEQQGQALREQVTIPVVVHVIWNTADHNISDAQILSQIAVLNEDFGRMNSDTVNTPAMFKPFAADCEVNFCMAKRTPDSLPTNGIIRVYTPVAAFPMNNSMKSDYTGGSSAWDTEKYLNIWVCNLAGNILGYAQMPGGNDSTDGIVIHYRNFGRTGNLNPNYALGRTATHEVGHWLDLYHIWGDDFGSCLGTDYVDDTPNAADANYYCPNHPHTSSCNSTGEMFMNYMDYVDDDCFNIYTAGQRDRMHAAIAAYRQGLLSSDGCDSIVGIEDREIVSECKISPNPSSGLITLSGINKTGTTLRIEVFDLLGRPRYETRIEAAGPFITRVDLSKEGNGLYLVRFSALGKSFSERILIQ